MEGERDPGVLVGLGLTGLDGDFQSGQCLQKGKLKKWKIVFIGCFYENPRLRGLSSARNALVRCIFV
jgi:hypothetical protein